MILREDLKGRLYVETKNGNEYPHIIHCADSLEEIKKDSFITYLVAENRLDSSSVPFTSLECTNHARLHLLTEWSKDSALDTISIYLREIEGHEDPHLIEVFKLNF